MSKITVIKNHLCQHFMCCVIHVSSFWIRRKTTVSMGYVKNEHWAAKSRVSLDSTFKKGGEVLNRVESTELTRAITVVYTQDYPITLSMDGIDQMSRLAVYLFQYHYGL